MATKKRQQTINKRNRERAVEEKRTLKRQAKQEKRMLDREAKQEGGDPAPTVDEQVPALEPVPGETPPDPD